MQEHEEGHGQYTADMVVVVIVVMATKPSDIKTRTRISFHRTPGLLARRLQMCLLVLRLNLIIIVVTAVVPAQIQFRSPGTRQISDVRETVSPAYQAEPIQSEDVDALDLRGQGLVYAPLQVWDPRVWGICAAEVHLEDVGRLIESVVVGVGLRI